MQRTDFGAMACSIARTLDVVGEPWSLLVLRDIYVGITRFDQIQADLGISRKVLTERLTTLTEQQVLFRTAYSTRPPRYEYLLTKRGLDLCDLLLIMVRWGDTWRAATDGPPVLHRHRACGAITHAVLRCPECDQPMSAADTDVLPRLGQQPE